MPSSSSTTNTTTTSTSTADQETSNNNEDNEASSSSFDLYRNDFKIHIQQIELKFHDNNNNNNTKNNDDDKNISYKSSTSSSPSPSLVSIQELLKNCDELIQQMELEIIQRGGGGTTTTKDDDSSILFVKQNQKDILQACKLQLLSYKTLEKTTHHRQPKNKNNTKSSSTNDTDKTDGKDEEDKTLLLWDETIERNYLQQAMVIQDSVGRQNNRLSEALQSIRETEQVANSISVELTKNRQKISSAHNKTKSISSMTQNADKLIKSMSKPWWKFWG